MGKRKRDRDEYQRERSDDELKALTDDDIRRRMKRFRLGCVVHERSLMLNEGSKREDQWLKSMCRREFDSQDRVDMSLSGYLNAICKEFHRSYSKGAAGNGFLQAFHLARYPDAPLMPLPTPGPGNRFCITSHLALCLIINFDVYIAYLYKVRAVGGGGAADDVKDGVLLTLRVATTLTQGKRHRRVAANLFLMSAMVYASRFEGELLKAPYIATL